MINNHEAGIKGIVFYWHKLWKIKMTPDMQELYVETQTRTNCNSLFSRQIRLATSQLHERRNPNRSLTAVWQPTVLIWLGGLDTEINVDDLSWNKTVFRVSLSPKSKGATYIFCVECLVCRTTMLSHQLAWTWVVVVEILIGAKLAGHRLMKVIWHKLFVKTVPEATETWWKGPLNKGAIYLVEREAGSRLHPGSRSPFKYL